MINNLPRYFSYKAIVMYYMALAFVTIIFFKYAMPWYMFLFATVSIFAGFYFTAYFIKTWSKSSIAYFIQRLFFTALLIRLIWVAFSYVYFVEMYGEPFEFLAADAKMYDDFASKGATMISKGIYNILPILDKYAGKRGLDTSDSGYVVYLSFIYYLTDNSLIIIRLIKALFGAWTCVLVYKVVKRNFGESVARMSAIFCMLMPNLIYYTGLHLKEPEMIFLTLLFVERADNIIRQNNIKLRDILAPLLIAVTLFTFRTILGVTAMLTLFVALVFTSQKIMNIGKRIFLSVFIFATLAFFIGGNIAKEVSLLWEYRNVNQKQTLEWRSEREFGNKFSKYVGASLFAPMIFAIPFPTIVDVGYQPEQQMLNGGNYFKGIMAFFVVYALFLIIKEKKWGNYMTMASFMVLYLIIIALSSFAHSERFHQPAIPLELSFAAYGITRVTNKTKKYFRWYLIFMFFVIVAWSIFKLAGRNLI